MQARRLQPGLFDIVVVCDHAHVSGGLAQVAHSSACALSRQGHRVTFFAAVAPVAPTLSTAGVEVVCLDQPDMLADPSRARAAARALWNIPAAKRLTALLEGLDPASTVVHVHGWSKALSPSVLHAAARSGLSVVHTLHDYVSQCPNGAFYDYVHQRNCKLTPMSAACVMTNCDTRSYGHKLWRVARHTAMLASERLHGIDDVIYMVEGQRAILAPHLARNVRTHHVANPVGIPRGDPVDVAQNRRFVYIGRLSAEKGVVSFALAAAHAGVEAVFVGDGPARADVAAAAPGAMITGWVDNEVVRQHLCQARAVVFPSLWYETFGLAVYEALASGVPPIVSDNTVSAEAVLHGVTGLLFRSGDVDDLARRLTELTDGRRAAALGRAAHTRYWQDPLTLDRHADRLVEVYRAVIARRADGGASCVDVNDRGPGGRHPAVTKLAELCTNNPVTPVP